MYQEWRRCVKVVPVTRNRFEVASQRSGLLPILTHVSSRVLKAGRMWGKKSLVLEMGTPGFLLDMANGSQKLFKVRLGGVGLMKRKRQELLFIHESEKGCTSSNTNYKCVHDGLSNFAK